MPARPEEVGSPSPHILCHTCSTRLAVLWKNGRWTLCAVCDAGWSRNAQLDTAVRVGPPNLMRIEGR